MKDFVKDFDPNYSGTYLVPTPRVSTPRNFIQNSSYTVRSNASPTARVLLYMEVVLSDLGINYDLATNTFTPITVVDNASSN